MEHRLVKAALRVLSDTTFPLNCTKPEDMELRRRNTRPEERDLEAQALAYSMVRPFLARARVRKAA
jgi:hypothetical protein